MFIRETVSIILGSAIALLPLYFSIFWSKTKDEKIKEKAIRDLQRNNTIAASIFSRREQRREVAGSSKQRDKVSRSDGRAQGRTCKAKRTSPTKILKEKGE